MEAMQNEANQRHIEVKGELAQMQEFMIELSQQVLGTLHQNTNTQKGQYRAPTRFTKMDLPRFMKEDVVGWLSKCESYFDLDQTPEDHKVTMASLVLDEEGYRWYDGLKSSSLDPITWRVFAEGLRVRFQATIQRPLEELMQLKQKR